jgi:hypothetical protein
MARGITIGEVTNILDSNDIVGNEKLPVSSGETEPQVVTTGELREYIQEGLPKYALTNIEIENLLNRNNV